nr:MAG TPA: toxin [Caudoviricetes sp.]
MEVIITFLVAVAAGVACHYIIKWLDGDHKDNK